MEAAGAVATKPTMKANQALVAGRINHVNSFDSTNGRVFEHRVAIPARDEFSMPGAVMIQSARKLGGIGEDVKVLVEVSGFPDKWTDKHGEVHQTARIVLRTVE